MGLKKRFIVKIIRTKGERERNNKLSIIMLWKESKAMTTNKGKSERMLMHWRFKRIGERQMARLVCY